MKALHLSNALKLIQGAVSKEKDLVELSGGLVKTADGVWFASAKLLTPGEMVMSFNKLKSISGLVPPNDEITVEQKNVNCVVKSGASVWKLNLRGDELLAPPSINGDAAVYRIGGHQIMNAIKSLRHLMKTDLSRPGLLSSWLTPGGEMVCGDGARLAGYQIGDGYDLELPNSVLLELYRILGVVMSESMLVEQDDACIRFTLEACSLHVPPLADRFEREWMERVREQLETEAEGTMDCSRSELQEAVNAVKVVSGFNLVEMVINPDYVILKAGDESSQKCVSRVSAKADYSGSVLLDLSHLDATIQSRKDELLKFTIAAQVVEIKDPEGWEILVRKQP